MGNKFEDEERINAGEEDEMVIMGYRRSYFKTLLTWILVILSCGLLLVIMSWRRSINMLLTHSRCSLQQAKKVLLIDSYQQQFVEPVVCPPDTMPLAKHYTAHFFNKKIKYIWDPEISKFVRVGGLEVANCAQFYSMSGGLHTTEALFRLQFFGKNSIFVEVKPVFKLILREIRSPFYIYQMFIVVVWLIQVYYQFAVCIVLLSTISIAATVWETRKQSKALRDAVRADAIVTVVRDGKEVQKSSDELVPGDVIIIPPSQFTMVCDAVLLSGNCVVNESMLTGESTPITKVPITYDPTLTYSTTSHKRSTLFCGTQILHSRNCEDDVVKAVVYRTGFSTAKGELVRAILFPKPVNLKLYTDLFKCMVAFIFLGIPPMVYTAIIWAKLGAYVHDVVIIVVDVATFVVPPVLPAVLTSINAHAQRRLRKSGIYCLNSRYINFCGGLDVVCFDKTGTLTEDSLDFSGAIPVENGRFEAAVKDLRSIAKSKLVLAVATCHSLTKVGDRFLGHTLDAKLFEASGWVLEEPEMGETCGFEKSPPRIAYAPIYQSGLEQVTAVAIIRQFPFESLLRRMSVVTKSKNSDHFDVYIKGAPELIASLSLPQTVPEDFKDVLDFYTRQGFRVLGVAWKSLPKTVTWEKAQRLKREDLESGVHFQGLIVLQNRLKPETVPTLKVLKSANIRTIMVTGDNLLTAMTVARDCGMIEEYDAVISVDAELMPSSAGRPAHLRVHYNFAKLPGISEKLNMLQNGSVDEIYLPRVTPSYRYHIAMEGKAFNLIRLHDCQLLDKVVLKGTIFSRMLPEHKLYLIETLQKLGYQVGMCGDGANDCGALKTAHAGVSLSVAEASVASPFTATEPNIECIPTVIREGRATLSATFGAFRYMVCYCFVLLSAVLMMFWDGQKPSDGGYVVIDIVLSLIPPIIFGSTEAFEGLVKRPPIRSIISFLPLFSMFSFIFFQIGVYILAYEYCLSQPWYEPFEYDRNNTHTPAASHSGTAILSVNMMSYVIAAIIFSPGPPYRKNFFSNKLYTVVIVIEFLLVSFLTVHPPEFISGYINFRRAPFIEYHLVLYVLSLLNFIFCFLWEMFFVQGVLFEYVVPFLRRLRGPIHRYEKLEQALQVKNEWPPVGKMQSGKTLSFNDDEDTELTRQPSSSQRNHWARRSSELRRSLLVGLKLSKTSERKDSRFEPVSFVTFKDGKHQLETDSPTQAAQGFV